MNRPVASALAAAVVAVTVTTPAALARPVSPEERRAIEADVRLFGFWGMNWLVPGITQLGYGETGRGLSWMAGSWIQPIVGFFLGEWLFGQGALFPPAFRTQDVAPFPWAGFAGMGLGMITSAITNAFSAQDAYRLEVERQIRHLESLPDPTDATAARHTPVLHWRAATGWETQPITAVR